MGKRRFRYHASAAKTSWSLRANPFLESCFLRTHRRGISELGAQGVYRKRRKSPRFFGELACARQTEKDCGIVSVIYGWELRMDSGRGLHGLQNRLARGA